MLDRNEERFRKISFIAVLICSYYLFLSVTAYKRTWQQKPEEYNDLPKLSDLLGVPLITAIIATVFKRLMSRIATPMFMPIVKDQDSPMKRKERAERCVVELKKLTVNLGFSIYGFLLLKETDFYPASLGGHG
jgi:hypothetical protein